MKKKGKNVIKTILNIVSVFIIIVAAIVVVVSLAGRDRGVANIYGHIPFSIQSESMKNVMDKGDLIITKKYDGSELKENDIISFFAMEGQTQIIKTHRIIEVKKRGNLTSYVTKGDNNEIEDGIEVAPGDIISIYEGFKIPKVGYALDAFKSKYGFLFLIILPLFALFIYQLYSFITLVVDYKKDQAIKEIKDASKKV
jgi:signal peptidase I